MTALYRHNQLLDHHPIISDQIGRPALGVVLRELERVVEQGIDGAVAEFGCYIGTTSVFVRRLLNDLSSDKQFYAYDSFAGLPEKASVDTSRAGDQFQAGELTVSKRQFLESFHKAHLKPPITIKAWFKDLTPTQLPDTLAFAFLDGDFYDSILDSLKLVWPRLQTGGVVTIDDYQREALPGVTRAVNDFFHGTPAGLHYEHNIAIIRKS